MRKLLLFDLDWTLVYTGGAGVRALNNAFGTHFGVDEAMKTVSPDGKTDPAIIREMIRVHLSRDASSEEIEKLCQLYIENLEREVAISPGYRIMPGIVELLPALQAESEVIMGLGTGNLEKGARIKLQRADLLKYFKFGGYSTDAEDRPKVLAAGVRRGETLAGHSFSPRDVVVIGDNMRDVQAGKAIGATTVAVATGPMSYEELSRTDPDHIFRDLSQTAEVLHRLL